MNIYHTDVDLRIVESIEKEFGRSKNLLVTPQNYMKVRYNWQENDDYGCNRDVSKPVFGFEQGSNLNEMIIINKDGYFHHFIKHVVERINHSLQSQRLRNNFAFVLIDQHLDFFHQYMHANFVGRIFNDLQIPVYILTEALCDEEISDLPKPDSKFCLIRPIKKSEKVQGAFNLVNRTMAVYETRVSEHYLYLSTDLDAFSSELFLTEWARGARKDFGIDSYKKAISRIVGDKSLLGLDFTGLSLKGSGKLGDSEKCNKKSLDNLVDLVRFMSKII